MKDADITSALGVGQSTVEYASAVWRRGSSLPESQKATASASKETGKCFYFLSCWLPERYKYDLGGTDRTISRLVIRR